MGCRRAAPVDRLPNYERLVHPEWLRDLLDGGRPEPRLREATSFPRELRRSGGVRGQSHPGASTSTPTGRGPDRLEPSVARSKRRCAARNHIRHDGRPLRPGYGRTREREWPGRRAGQIAAARAALILTYCGRGCPSARRRVRPVGAGGSSTRDHPAVAPSSAFGVRIPARPDVIVDIDEAKQIVSDVDRAALVSVRTWREHIGEVSGYNYIQPAGRIAGDVWGNCGSDAYHMQPTERRQHDARLPGDRPNWADPAHARQAGGVLLRDGWRASETWFYAHLMGWSRLRSTTAVGSSGAAIRRTTRSRSV